MSTHHAARTLPHARRRAGFTLVEVMVSISVLAIGVTGILAMQNAAVLSNRRAQEMTTATNIARRWQERLRRDALQWNSPSQQRTTSDLGTDTRYLCQIVGCGASGSATENSWFIPASNGSGATLESAGFDAWGNDVDPGSASVRYCTHVRLNWLIRPTSVQQGIVRAEVRVWWFREGVTRPTTYANCGGNAATVNAMSSDLTTVSWVYMAQALGGNPL